MQAPVEEDDLYAILGVPPQASEDDIKLAYRREAKVKHPDKHNNSEEATKAFQKLNEANAVLSDLKQRAEYDKQRVSIDLFKATVAGDAQAIIACLQKCWDSQYVCRRFSYELNNRKVKITPLELAIHMKRLDLVEAFFSNYDAKFIAVLLHEGHIYQIALESFDENVFNFLKFRVGHITSTAVRRQLASSSLPPLAIQMLLDPRYPLLELPIIHNLFMNNMTEEKRNNLSTLLKSYADGCIDFICHLFMNYDTLKRQAKLTGIPMPVDCYLSNIRALGFSDDNSPPHKRTAVTTAFISNVKDDAAALPIWKSLDSLGIPLTKGILLNAVMHNHSVLEGLFEFVASKPLPTLLSEDLVLIYFSVLKISIPPGTLLAITRHLQKVIPDLLLWKDGFQNNCLHTLCHRPPEFLKEFLALLSATHSKEDCLFLLNDPDSTGQIAGPVIVLKCPEFAKKLELLTQPPRATIKNPPPPPPSTPTPFFQNGSHITPPLNFHSSYQLLSHCIHFKNDLAELKVLLDNVPWTTLGNNHEGYPLLSIAVSRRLPTFVAELLRRGMDVFLVADTLNRRRLYSAVKDPETRELLLQAQNSITNQRKARFKPAQVSNTDSKRQKKEPDDSTGRNGFHPK